METTSTEATATETLSGNAGQEAAASTGNEGQAATGTETQQAAEKLWTDGLSDVHKNFVNEKQFKGVGDVIDSYSNFQKLQGVPQDRLLKLPESLQEGDEARALWQKLGAPAEASEYKIEIPEENGDPKMAEWAQETFHKAGLPRHMADMIIKSWNDRAVDMNKTSAEELQNFFAKEESSLKNEWAGEYETKSNIVDQAAKSLGFDEAEIQALGKVLGPSKSMKLLYRLGSATGEAKYVGNDGKREDVKTPDTAMAEIKELMKDTDFTKKLKLGDTDANMKWNRLHEMAAPGQTTI